MTTNTITLSTQEKKWILESRFTRQHDDHEVQIYPMGAERFLSSILFNNKKNQYDLVADIKGKDVLCIPGHGNNCFLFAHAGAKSVAVYDKDPVTIAWIRAFKKYYNYRAQSTEQHKPYPSIGEILTALTCWYPPLITLPSRKYKNIVSWVVHPNSLRRTYIHYMISLARDAVRSNPQEDFELNMPIQFHAGEIEQLIKKKQVFDTAYVPYLLGVKNGIENENDIVHFIKQLIKIIPNGNILVTPSQSTKEFNLVGKRYFCTTEYSDLESIPQLESYSIGQDKNWYSTQGLSIFSHVNETEREARVRKIFF